MTWNTFSGQPDRTVSVIFLAGLLVSATGCAGESDDAATSKDAAKAADVSAVADGDHGADSSAGGTQDGTAADVSSATLDGTSSADTGASSSSGAGDTTGSGDVASLDSNTVHQDAGATLDVGTGADTTTSADISAGSDTASTVDAGAAADSGGSGATNCSIGGTTSVSCPSGEYCKLNSGCFGAGVCTAKPMACIGLFDEVCGCDGKNHSNSCVAASKGANVKHKGPCKVPPIPGCCDTAADCKSNQVCFTGPHNAYKCKSTDNLTKGQCWTDAQCPAGSTCENATACGCKALCKAMDMPGTCSKPPSACAKVDPQGYGLCDMLLGYGWDGAKCAAVSGCSCKSDCAKLFKTKVACEKACAKKP